MPDVLSASTKIIARKPVKRVYWIAWTQDKLTSKFPAVHHGFTEPNQETVSGQPEYETFDNEADWLVRLKVKFEAGPDESKEAAVDVEAVVIMK